MHPAFSVIFFTTASGAGFGLFAWMGLLAMCDRLPGRTPAGIALIVGAVFAAVGLCSSVLHLGQPQRAWRALSQWRSSWLSREGVVAVATFLPAAWLGFAMLFAPPQSYGGTETPIASSVAMQLAGALLFVFALATVACTAMIYASLKPIPAWRHPMVLPVYLVFAMYSGGLLLLATLKLTGGFLPAWSGVAILAGAVLLLLAKLRAWHHVDHDRSAVLRNSALGLPHRRPVQVFERPHTEANYLLKEMGYVLARKHAKRLRMVAMLLFALVPAVLALPLSLLPHFDGGIVLLPLALISALTGALVERWLFFAEARHLVTLYY